MLRYLLLAALAVVTLALPADVSVKEELVRIGSAGVTYVNFRGFLVPIIDPETKVPTLLFRTTSEGELEPSAGLLSFRCTPLDDVVADDANKAVLLCTGTPFEKKMVFLFSSEGIHFAPHERTVHLMLERDVLMKLNSVPETLLGTTILGDRVKRQFGLGFSGSGAQASSSSFGGGGGFGGFPGGGFGGGFSGSQASAGASSFGGGGGFFG